MNTRQLIAASLISAFASVAAHAGGDVLYYRADERPDPAMVARILGAPSAEVKAPTVRTRSIRTRSIHLIQSGTSEPVQTAYAGSTDSGSPGYLTPESPAAAQPARLALPVQFAFDSSAIAPSATFQLDAVAEGIKLAGSSVHVVIEGHTDARGTDEYNLHLSLARANAVKSYLVRQHGIDPDQLSVSGRGEAFPYVADDPFAASNRRVEFHAARG